MALALYRRYRPDTFDGIIGQKQVTVPLSRALDNGRLTHAYLFSGPRGCGKTSSARILARCINCEKGPTSHPCGECASCKDLATGGPGSIDVVEIDAASHNGVDDARELRERAAFAPARDRYKIFILDEAHMVTAQGFNALLKIVEEPPEHVMFIFATTEPDKVISTIRSRTHHYPFRLVPEEVMGPYLEQVCDQEKIKPDAGVLKLAMRAGGGSVRDTLSVLDQLMVGAEDGKISYDSAVALLGFTPDALIGQAIDAVVDGDGKALYDVVEKVVVGGFEPRRFVEDLLARVRDLLVLTLGGEQAVDELDDETAEQDLSDMRRQASALGLQALTAMAEIIDGALADMVGATSPRMRLELLAARLLVGKEQGFAQQTPQAAGAQAGDSPAAAATAQRSGFIGASNGNRNGAAGNMNGSGHGGFAGSRDKRTASAPVGNVQADGNAPAAGAQTSVQTSAGTPAGAPTTGSAQAPISGSAAPAAAGMPASNAGNGAVGESAAKKLSVAERLVQEKVGRIDPSASVEEKWSAVLKALPQDVSEYVDSAKVPHVALQTNSAGRSRLAMTFDTALSQHAFALAIASEGDFNGKKASHVVLQTVRAVFGAQMMIAPTATAANGEHVVSTNRMKPEELVQVKRRIAMAKAGLASGGIGEPAGHEASEHKEQKKTGGEGQTDADDTSHRGGANGQVVGQTVIDSRFDDDDPWTHMASSIGNAGLNASQQKLAHSGGSLSDTHKAKKHIAVPDVSDGVDPWAVPAAGSASPNTDISNAASDADSPAAADSDAIAHSETADSSTDASANAAMRGQSASNATSQHGSHFQGAPDSSGQFGARQANAASARPMPNFDMDPTDSSGAGAGNAGPQVAAEDDDYSLDDQSLGQATAMNIDQLSKLFEVKKVEQFAADDPQNPKNIKKSDHHLSDQPERGRQ